MRGSRRLTRCAVAVGTAALLGALGTAVPARTLADSSGFVSAAVFPVPGHGVSINQDGGPDPMYIASGPDDDLWYTVPNRHEVVRITTSGISTAYQLPSPNDNDFPWAITEGPDDAMWFTIQGSSGSNPAPYQIGRIDPATGAISEYATNLGAYSSPIGIVSLDGKLWFADPGAPAIGEMSTSGVMLNSYGASTLEDPAGITTANGLLFFTDQNMNAVGSLNPANGDITTYPLPTAGASPLNLTEDAFGNIWFTEGIGQLGRLDVDTGTITEFPAYTNSYPFDITLANDGNLYYSSEQSGRNVGIYEADPSTGAITDLPIANNIRVEFGLTDGPDGNLWWTMPQGLGQDIDTASPQLAVTATADAPSVEATAQIGYDITVSNSSPIPGRGVDVSMTAPLPAGSGIDWRIDHQDARSCSVTGATGAQAVACTFADLDAGATYDVHVVSATTDQSAATYPVTATLSAANEVSIPPANATTVVSAPAATPTPKPITTRPDPTPPPSPKPVRIPPPDTGAMTSQLAGGALLTLLGVVLLLTAQYRRLAPGRW